MLFTRIILISLWVLDIFAIESELFKRHLNIISRLNPLYFYFNIKRVKLNCRRQKVDPAWLKINGKLTLQPFVSIYKVMPIENQGSRHLVLSLQCAAFLFPIPWRGVSLQHPYSNFWVKITRTFSFEFPVNKESKQCDIYIPGGCWAL